MKRGLIAESILVFFTIVAVFSGFILYTGYMSDAWNLVYSDIIYVVFAALAAVFGIIAVRVYSLGTPEGKLLLLLTLVPIFDALAGTIWAYNEIYLSIIAPFPSISDGIWFLFYVAGISAFIYALNKVRKFITAKNALIATIAFGALFALIYSFSLKFIFLDLESTLLIKFLSAMYPVGDIILGSLALLLFLSLKGSKLGDSWRTFTIAYWVYAIADLVYTYQLYAGTFKSGNATDIFWFLGQVIMAYGFYQQIRLLKPR